MEADWMTTPEYRGARGMFLKMEAGDRVRVVPVGTVHIRFVRWADGRSETAAGPGPGVKVRFIAIVYNIEDGQLQLLELAPKFWSGLLDSIREDGGGKICQIIQIRQKDSGKKKELLFSPQGREQEARSILDDIEEDDIPEVKGAYPHSAWVWEGGRPVRLRDGFRRLPEDSRSSGPDPDDPRFRSEPTGSEGRPDYDDDIPF